MERDEILKSLNGIFQNIFDDSSLQIQETFSSKDIDGWDSINHINLIVEAEKTFSIKFTTKEIRGLQNIREFVDLIKRKK